MIKAIQIAEAPVHQEQDNKGIEHRDHGARKQRNPEQELKRHDRADDLGQITGDDGQFAGQPQHDVDGRWKMVATGLCEIPPGRDTQPC